MIKFTKDHYNLLANERRKAFERICKRLGKDHAITKMLGSRAWGRSNFEQGPDGNLQSAIREMAASDGAFDIINTWARDNDTAAQRILHQEYSTSFEPSRKATS